MIPFPFLSFLTSTMPLALITISPPTFAIPLLPLEVASVTKSGFSLNGTHVLGRYLVITHRSSRCGGVLECEFFQFVVCLLHRIRERERGSLPEVKCVAAPFSAAGGGCADGPNNQEALLGAIVRLCFGTRVSIVLTIWPGCCQFVKIWFKFKDVCTSFVTILFGEIINMDRQY